MTEAQNSSSEVRKTAIAYARGVAGGLLIGVPVLMTMEVWWHGFAVPAWRLLLLYAFSFFVLLILQHFSGLHHRKTWGGQVRAALVASGIGLLTSALILGLLGVLRSNTTLRDLAGKILLESIPVSIGASVAISEFGAGSSKATQRRETRGFWGSLGVALAGATLFGFGISATEEQKRVAAELEWFHALGLLLISIVQVVAIVYAVGFRQRRQQPDTSHSYILAEAV